MDTIALHIVPIIFTLLALGHVRSLAGRRSAMREGLATAGTILIMLGLSGKAILAAMVITGRIAVSDSVGMGYAVLAAGFVFLMYGFWGWDRMQLTRPGWGKPLITILACELLFALSRYCMPKSWTFAPIGMVVGCLLVMDLLLLGYTLRQRYYLATPFLLLHMLSVVINMLIEIHSQSYAHVVQGIVLTASTSALLFYINMWLIKRHTFRGKMLIV